jgi:hypothetical protein
MRGEFIGVWSEPWREIRLPLIDHEDVPEDIFCELPPGAGRANCNFAMPLPWGCNREVARATQRSDLQASLDSAIATDGSLVAIPEQFHPDSTTLGQAPHPTTSLTIDLR